MLGGHDLRWVELIERVARLSGVRHPLVVLPPEAGELARRAEELGLASPVAGEGVLLMAQSWRHSSAKARRELGYQPVISVPEGLRQLRAREHGGSVDA